MLNKLFQLFGSRSLKEIKRLLPIVADINAHFRELEGLSNDALREASRALKEALATAVKPTDDEVAALRASLSDRDLEVHVREKYFVQIEALHKKRNVQLEEALKEQLVPAFAIMKETARRFASGEKLLAQATSLDKELAGQTDYVTIEGETSCWTNEWQAAGNKVRWNMVHYDVQLIGGIILHQGKVAEMATGEGKTLVATLPAFLNGLSGMGVHIVTVNDYLARRDAAWNAPLFTFHGLRVDCIDSYPAHSPERAKSYQADIVYGTNNEFGFDYLRDNMTHSPDGIVQRSHHFGMVDEVDSVLIDEARTPLIISGPVSKSNEHLFEELKPYVYRLLEVQKKCCTDFLHEAKKQLEAEDTKAGGLALFRVHRGLPKYKPLIRYLSQDGVKQAMQRSENIYLQDNQRLMPEADAPLYFTIDEKNHSVELTEKGAELLSSITTDKTFFVIEDIGTGLAELEANTALSQQEILEKREALMASYRDKSERIHTLNQLLRAYTLYEKDTDYVLINGKVKIVDEQTGRVLSGRRYSDGLHQALEAKEGAKVQESSQTYATVTLQNYFRMYHKLAGMTGTAETEAAELWNIYNLEVTVIPTHQKIIRKDQNDKIYKTMREKFQAMVAEVKALRTTKRPILMGTTSVESSEVLSRLLKLQHIPHQVLNAKQHQREAEIVANAGTPSTVTIATNMAGRGTDIKLHPEALAAGGLAIIGSERHESRRVDRQLRGRSGRQGDPGSSQFFVSLEDTLMRLFGSARMSRWMDRMGLKEGEVIEHSMITKSIERAQKKVEENNFGTRKRLLEYDNVMNTQREVIYKRRRHALFGERIQVDLAHLCMDTCEEIAIKGSAQGSWSSLQLSLLEHFGTDLQLEEKNVSIKDINELTKQLYVALIAYYDRKKTQLRENVLPVLTHTYQMHRPSAEQKVAIPIKANGKKKEVVISLLNCIESKGSSLTDEIEKTLLLHCIDTSWKEHLRSMDDLKQSVQSVVYEQKDPLLVYKFEAFELFKRLLSELNKKTISYLLSIEVPTADRDGVVSHVDAERRRPPTSQQKLRANKASIYTNTEDNSQSASSATGIMQPVHSQKIAGRNDKVTVQYHDGRVEKKIKYKKISEDIRNNNCVILEVH